MKRIARVGSESGKHALLRKMLQRFNATSILDRAATEREALRAMRDVGTLTKEVRCLDVMKCGRNWIFEISIDI